MKWSNSTALGMGLLFGILILGVLPFTEGRPAFLFGLPMVMIFLMVMMTGVKAVMIVMLFARAGLDPLLNLTRIQVFGMNMGIGALLNLFMIMMTAVSFALAGPVFKKRPPWLIPLGLFFAYCFLSIFNSPEGAKALRICLSYLSVAALFFMPFVLIKTQKEASFWVKVLFFSTLAPLLLGDVGILTNWVPLVDNVDRLQGAFSHPNIFGFYCVFVVFITMFTWRTQVFTDSIALRFFMWAVLINVGCVLVYTQARSAWIGAWVFFMLFAFFKERRLFVYALIVPALLCLTPMVQNRLKDLSHDEGDIDPYRRVNSLAWRKQLWQDALPLMADRWLLGHGANSFVKKSPEFFKLNNKIGYHAHSLYVELQFEMGLVGLFLFLVGLLVYFKDCHQLARGSPYQAEVLLFLCYLFSYLVSGLSDNISHYLSLNWYIAFAAGLVSQMLRAYE